MKALDLLKHFDLFLVPEICRSIALGERCFGKFNLTCLKRDLQP